MHDEVEQNLRVGTGQAAVALFEYQANIQTAVQGQIDLRLADASLDFQSSGCVVEQPASVI
ncbi:hypothetical protein D9M70_513150 [compost metagenome]